MIYLSEDYFYKYVDTLGYIFSRAFKEKYSPLHIERAISYSQIAEELERSNITTIAFTSAEKIYQDIFPQYDNNDFIYDSYDKFGWLGYIYIQIFLKYQITFELIFMILPIETTLSMYPLYHEMNYTQMLDFFFSKIEMTYFNSILKYKNISSHQLSSDTNIPESTIAALRYKYRDILKLESGKLYQIAKVLDIKMTTLIPNLELETDKK